MFELDKLIRELEFKLESLPESYFINYFEETFLPKLKNISKKLLKIYNRCNEQADNLPMANLQSEIREIIK